MHAVSSHGPKPPVHARLIQGARRFVRALVFGGVAVSVAGGSRVLALDTAGTSLGSALGTYSEGRPFTGDGTAAMEPVDPQAEGVPAPRPLNPSQAQAHWAFRAPTPPAVPVPREGSGLKNPIDAFVRVRQEAEGLRPADPASRRALLRRLSFTLWGLPPEPQELQEFEEDRRPDAVERRVEALLASPRYGERWGRHWLDVARYADTKGYVYYYEESRFVRPHAYRDWVIQALNEDLPYDRFLALQIAADQMLPVQNEAAGQRAPSVATLEWPTPEYGPDVAALGFLTLGRRFLDLAPDIIDDRIDVVMRGTQALTVSCARCHDHKFDPIPTRDYYSLYGVFDGSEERLVAVSPASSPAENGDDGERYGTDARARVETLERRFREACEQVADRHRDRVTDYLVAALEVARLPSDANVRPQPEDVNPFQVRQWDRYLTQRAAVSDPVFVPWHAFAKIRAEEFAERASEVSAWILTQPAEVVHPAVRDVAQPPPRAMREVAERYGALLGRVRTEWRRTVSNAVERTAVPKGLADANDEALRRVLYGADSPVLAPPGTIVDLDVHLYFDDPNRVALAKLQMELEQWLMTNSVAPPHVLVLRDRLNPVEPVVFRRGDPAKRGETVPRQFLAALSVGTERTPFRGGSGRLELAEAITDPRNPLTSRVMVNRVWAQHFGEGLVRTPSDFGVRGDPPTHPELLDWLACWFDAHGRSMKALHRLILTSATFQQADVPSDAEALVRDPENRALTRFARRRLDFEAFRDSMLAVSGDLDERRGGPGDDLTREPFSRRRSVYGLVDRRQVPGMLRAFDVANPDLHAPRRHTTIVPQQSLILLNHPFVLERARSLAQRLDESGARSSGDRVQQLYRWTLQRPASVSECADGAAFVAAAEAEGFEDEALVGSEATRLRPWAELAQVLLLSNEFAFID